MPTPDTAETAQEILAEMMDERFVTALTSAGGRWVPDPSVPRVWGVEVDGKIVCVVYLDSRDFEADDGWFLARS